MFGQHTTAVAVLLSLLAVGWCEGSCIIAENTATPRNLGCTFSVSNVEASNSNCNTSLRQVFRLLDVNDANILVGSTECLYSLTPDLAYEDSEVINRLTSDSACKQENPAENQDFVCKNYITHGFTTATNNYTVCGTYDAVSPRCWNCNRTGRDLSCKTEPDEGQPTALMPTDPIENVTAIMTEDGTYFFIGGRQSANNLGTPDYQISRVDVELGDKELSTNDEDQVINTPVDFVGKPIEHGGPIENRTFIYMFFREEALEDYLQTTVYSRIARVAKADEGGDTNPLNGGFTTYLKTRLMCSCGETYPVVYNEIQDIEAVNDSGKIFLYGLFTKRNSMSSSSSAICRYSMAEVVEIFNSANRRGPSDDNININNDRTWSMRPKETGDETANRATYTKYPLDLDLYDHLLHFPLLNTNVPNCGLGRTAECTDGTRSSHNALAVFHNLRGQQLTISESSNDSVDVFIGTDNLQIVKATINETNAIITEDIRIITTSSSDTSEMHTDLKWPNGITSLTTSGDYLYGNSDTCVFGIPLVPPPPTTTSDPTTTSNPTAPSNSATTSNPTATCNPTAPNNPTGVVNERKVDTLASHTVKIDNAVTNFFTVFDAPMGVNMRPGFSGLFDDTICSGERFDAPANHKEVLHVSCQISTGNINSRWNVSNSRAAICANDNDTPCLTGNIAIMNGMGNEIARFTEVIDIDCTERDTTVSARNVSSYDAEMAVYRFGLNQWLKQDTNCNKTCSAGSCCSATQNAFP